MLFSSVFLMYLFVLVFFGGGKGEYSACTAIRFPFKADYEGVPASHHFYLYADGVPFA